MQKVQAVSTSVPMIFAHEIFKILRKMHEKTKLEKVSEFERQSVFRHTFLAKMAIFG